MFDVPVFVCAADETSDNNTFAYGGWAASLDVWQREFGPAWDDRVLAGPPRIPYLHMTEIRDWDWCAAHGLRPGHGEQRIGEAAKVLRSTGGLVPVIFSLDKNEYESIIKDPFRREMGILEPDYICFQWFAFTQLEWLHSWLGDEVERVDFWVEENGRVTRHMESYHAQLADGLRYVGREYLVPKIGSFLAVSKEKLPVQAADMLGWHLRNHRRRKLDSVGLKRYWQMTEAGSRDWRKGRYGHRGVMSREDMVNLATRFSGRLATEKPAERPDLSEASNSRAARTHERVT